MNIFFIAIILGIIEGLTEFIPISSTGHMILIGDLVHFTGEKAATFEVFIQLGAILSVVIIYRDRFLGLIPSRKSKKSLFTQLLTGDSMPTGYHILVAIIPILIVGFLLHGIIKSLLFNPVTVAIGLVVGGLIMLVVEIFPRQKTVDTIDQLSIKQAFLIGLGQCFAIWPGMSRSGSTMVTGLLLGVKHRPVADFSFIIAVPVMFAAVIWDMLKSWRFLEMSDLPYFSIGFLVSFIVGWASIKLFLKVLTTIKLIPFGIYRIILGVFILRFF